MPLESGARPPEAQALIDAIPAEATTARTQELKSAAALDHVAGTPMLRLPDGDAAFAHDKPDAVSARLGHQVTASCLVMFAEGYVSTQFFPYMASMVADLRGNEESIGMYTGLLYSSYSFGLMVMAWFWAGVSNHRGRRFCVITGLCCNIITTGVLAWSGNYWVSLSCRLASGMTNSNLSIMRTALRESFHYHDVDDTRAFSALSVAFGASCVAGPSLGGILFQRGLPFVAVAPCAPPWAAPVLSCTLMYVAAFVCTVILMQETAFLDNEVASAFVDPKGTATCSAWSLLKDVRFVLLLVVGAGHSYVFTGWELAYPLLAKHPLDDHGEAWSATEIGVTFLCGGLALLVYSLVIYPSIAGKCTIIQLWVASWALPVLVIAIFPRMLSAALVAGHAPRGLYVKALNYATQLFISVLVGSGFITLQRIINSFVATLPDGRAALALANSWVVSTQALVRMASPMLTGSLFNLGLRAERNGWVFLSRCSCFDSLALVGLITGVFCSLEFRRRCQTSQEE